jgi:hypothetical protein
LKTLGDSLRENPQNLILSLPGETEKVLLSGCCAYVEVDLIDSITLIEKDKYLV